MWFFVRVLTRSTVKLISTKNSLYEFLPASGWILCVVRRRDGVHVVPHRAEILPAELDLDADFRRALVVVVDVAAATAAAPD